MGWKVPRYGVFGDTVNVVNVLESTSKVRCEAYWHWQSNSPHVHNETVARRNSLKTFRDYNVRGTLWAIERQIVPKATYHIISWFQANRIHISDSTHKLLADTGKFLLKPRRRNSVAARTDINQKIMVNLKTIIVYYSFYCSNIVLRGLVSEHYLVVYYFLTECITNQILWYSRSITSTTLLMKK